MLLYCFFKFFKIFLKGPRKAHGSGDAVFYASFLAGIVSGAIASFLVTPLDVLF
jgi:solute carrier family 25 (mitochondrial glutamate transporter), member 18/22